MTIIENPAQNRIQAVFLKGHLMLMSKGMKNSQLSRKDVLKKASKITNKKYPNSVSGCEVAIADLQSIVDGK